jgi:CheY-like chemotaxis protein
LALPFISVCRAGALRADSSMEQINTLPSKLVILVVDDDQGHRELVRRNLLRAGITNTIIGLPNGKDALDYVFCRGEYAERRGASELLILLDINMPGIDGIEVLRQMKADPRKKKIPVIMLTTTDDPREISRCYELGCSVYVAKPVDPSAFIEAVKRLGMFIPIVRVAEEL